MAEDRPFPPSARRTALARAAGVTAASPVLVGAAACTAAALVLAMTAGTAATRLGDTLRDSIRAAGTLSYAEPGIGADVPAPPFGRVAPSLRNLAPSPPSASGAPPQPQLASAADALHDHAVRPAPSPESSGATHFFAGPFARAADGAAAASTDLAPGSPLVDAREMVAAVGSFALPLLAALAIAALLAHLAQTRAVWLPRRTLPGAPAADPMRATNALLPIVNGAVIGLVTLGWLYAMAPRLAALGVVPRAAGLMLTSFVAALAIAWLALGAIDALVRYAGYASGMRMTRAEQREDARLAGADPRWRQRRERLARAETPASVAVAGSSVLVLGDGIAVAIAWDPLHRPVPTRTAVGRAARATQLLALARRRSLPVHRDAELAVLLATDEGPVPERLWARLADVIAAVRRR